MWYLTPSCGIAIEIQRIFVPGLTALPVNFQAVTKMKDAGICLFINRMRQGWLVNFSLNFYLVELGDWKTMSITILLSFHEDSFVFSLFFLEKERNRDDVYLLSTV